MGQELWSLPFLLVLLHTTGFCPDFAKEISFEVRSSLFSKMAQYPNKTFFLLHQHLCHKFGFCGDKQLNPCFFCLFPITFSDTEGKYTRSYTIVEFLVFNKYMAAYQQTKKQHEEVLVLPLIISIDIGFTGPYINHFLAKRNE